MCFKLRRLLPTDQVDRAAGQAQSDTPCDWSSQVSSTSEAGRLNYAALTMVAQAMFCSLENDHNEST